MHCPAFLGAAPFFPTHSVLWGFPGVFTDSDLLSTQDRLVVFTVHLLSHILAEHSQHWHGWLVGRTGGRARGRGFQTPPGPSVHGSYPGLCPLFTLWWPQDFTNPLGLRPAMAAFGELLVILFTFFSAILACLFTFILLCVWVLLFSFSRPDFLLFLFFFMLFYVIACTTSQLRLEGIFWIALFSFWIVVHFLPGF